MSRFGIFLFVAYCTTASVAQTVQLQVTVENLRATELRVLGTLAIWPGEWNV